MVKIDVQWFTGPVMFHGTEITCGEGWQGFAVHIERTTCGHVGAGYFRPDELTVPRIEERIAQTIASFDHMFRGDGIKTLSTKEKAHIRQTVKMQIPVVGGRSQ